MAEKRPPLPLVLTGNALLGGESVYWDGTGWSERLTDARVATDEGGADALESARTAPGVERLVVDPYLVTAALGGDGHAAPAHYREHMRVIGPSFRDDFGRNPDVAEEADNVSL